MARLIGTAGHVDHGKTSLIKALTGIDTDRLPEEKARGLTIDVGFAHIEFPDLGAVSIVDVPGHERFVGNMLVGAQGVDLALLCVAADESVMPQTLEHLQILDLLPVGSMVVAMTKADRAAPILREVVAAEIQEALASTRFAGSPVVPVSVVTGEGIEALKAALRRNLSGHELPVDGPWYLPVDRVFTVKGHGTVVTGTLLSGRVQEGDVAVVEPGGNQAKIRQIQRHGRRVRWSEKGHRTALNLAGLRHEDLRRGMIVGSPGLVHASTVLDAAVRFMTEPRHGMRVRASIGADEAMGKMFLNDDAPHIVQLRLERPCAVVAGQPVVIRKHSPPTLVAGGTVTVPLASPRRRNQPAEPATTGPLSERLVARVGLAPFGLTSGEASRLVGQTGPLLEAALAELQSKGLLLGFAGLWFTPMTFERASQVYLETLAALHAANPARPSVPRIAVSKQAGLGWTGNALDSIVAHLAKSGRVATVGSEVALPGHRPELEPKRRAFLDRVKEVLESGGFSPPNLEEAARTLGAPVQAVEGIVTVGCGAGEIVRLDGRVYFTSDQVARAFQTARNVLAGRPFTAAEFKEALGTTRKFAIPLLEHADAKGWTLRRGERRVFTERSD
jgi:selenocysteine-specific elongation factor